MKIKEDKRNRVNKRNSAKSYGPDFIRELEPRTRWIYWFSVGFDFWITYMFLYHLGFRYR